MSGTDSLKQLFLKFDADGNGALDPGEIKLFIDDLVPGDVSTAAAQRLVIAMDENGDGEIDIDEFITFFRDQSQKSKMVIHERHVPKTWARRDSGAGVTRTTASHRTRHEQQKRHHTRAHQHRSSVSGGFLGAAVTARATANAKMVGQNALDGVLSQGFGHCQKKDTAISSAKAYLRVAVNAKKGKLQAIWQRFDPAGVGSLDFDKFIDLIGWLCPNEVNHSSMVKLLHAIDANGDGMIQLEEFTAFLNTQDVEQGDQTWT